MCNFEKYSTMFEILIPVVMSYVITPSLGYSSRPTAGKYLLLLPIPGSRTTEGHDISISVDGVIT